MLETLFYNLCELMISTSLIIIIIIWILPYADKNFGVKWRKTLWALLAIRLIIPYNFSLTNALIKLPKINFNITDNGWSMPLTIVLTLAWVMGVFVYLRMQQLHFGHFRNDIMDVAKGVQDQNILEIFNQIKNEHHIKKVISLYKSEIVKTPMVLGVFHPVMILPHEDYSMEDVSNIFHHEFIHIKNHDGWYKIFMMVITSLYWFNPFIHIMVKFSYNDVELVCDKEVTEKMDKSQRARYSETILDTISQEKKRDFAITTCFYGSKKMLKKRIENVFDEKQKKSGYSVMALIIVIFIGFDSLISCGYAIAGSNTETIENQSNLSTKIEVSTQAPTKAKSLLDDYVHPYNDLVVDTEISKKARAILLENLSDEDKKSVTFEISLMHWWIDNLLLSNWIDRSSTSSMWNYIYYVASYYDNAEVRMGRSDYTGVECIQSLEKIKNIVNNQYFSLDIDKAIVLMQSAIDIHDLETLYKFHQIVHDLDYWLLNYPIKPFIAAPADWHGVYVYFGVLESYKCIK